MKVPASTVAAVGLIAGLGWPNSVAAQSGIEIPAAPMQGRKVRIDGWLKEWGGFKGLGKKVKGSGDAKGSGVVGYDNKNIYVALKITDDKLVAGHDHGSLLLTFPRKNGGYANYEFQLYPGQPGKSKARVKKKGGGAVAGAKIVESAKNKEILIEAQIPWSAIPEARTIRVGLHGALRYSDFDAPGRLGSIIGTSAAPPGAGLPRLRLANEVGLNRKLLKAKGLGAPDRRVLANVYGNALLEEVSLYDQYLTILGPGYRKGKQFFYKDLKVQGPAMVKAMEVKDFTGDGKADIFIVRRAGSETNFREYVELMTIAKDGSPFIVFEIESAVVKGDGKIVNTVSVVKHKGKPAIKVTADLAEGWDKSSYREPTQDKMGNVLYPWAKVGSRTYAWDGKTFAVVEEKAQEPTFVTAGSGGGTSASGSGSAGTGASKPAGPPPPPRPRPPSADELQDRVYALYRKTRKVGKGKPRFDFVTDIAGDRQNERVLVHGADVVVFGKGFLGGTSFSYISLPVKSPSDVVHVTARDLTGDGKAEIIVRAVQKMKTSDDFGGVVIDRYAMLVYKVSGDKLVRIFSAETGRKVGTKLVLGSIAFKPQGNSTKLALEIRPGRVKGWTKDTYPFPVDTQSSGGLEPLLVPWGKLKKIRYEFDGSVYARQ